MDTTAVGAAVAVATVAGALWVRARAQRRAAAATSSPLDVESMGPLLNSAVVDTALQEIAQHVPVLIGGAPSLCTSGASAQDIAGATLEPLSRYESADGVTLACGLVVLQAMGARVHTPPGGQSVVTDVSSRAAVALGIAAVAVVSTSCASLLWCAAQVLTPLTRARVHAHRPFARSLRPQRVAHPVDVSRLTLLPSPRESPALLRVVEAVRLARLDLESRVPLVVSVPGPWTLMYRLCNGASEAADGEDPRMSPAKVFLYKHPASAKQLLDSLTATLSEFMVSLARAGAQMIIVEESAAAALSPAAFSTHVMPRLSKAAKTVRDVLPLHADGPPLAVAPRGAPHALQELRRTRFDCVVVDSGMDPAEACARLGPGITVLGELDPAVYCGSPDEVDAHVADLMHVYGKHPLITTVGHGSAASEAQTSAMLEAVHSASGGRIVSPRA